MGYFKTMFSHVKHMITGVSPLLAALSDATWTVGVT